MSYKYFLNGQTPQSRLIEALRSDTTHMPFIPMIFYNHETRKIALKKGIDDRCLMFPLHAVRRTNDYKEGDDFRPSLKKTLEIGAVAAFGLGSEVVTEGKLLPIYREAHLDVNDMHPRDRDRWPLASAKLLVPVVAEVYPVQINPTPRSRILWLDSEIALSVLDANHKEFKQEPTVSALAILRTAMTGFLEPNE